MTGAPVNGAERGKRGRTFDARKLGEIINNDFARMDMIVNKRNAFFRAIPSQDRDTCKTEASRANDTLRTIGPELYFLLQGRNTI